MSSDLVPTLNDLVADFTVFYQKMRHYHWNVKGEQFFKLHEKFEEIYTEVGDQIDELAERVIGLDGTPVHTLAHVLESTSIQEDPSVPAAGAMVKATVADLETLSASLMAAIAAAEEADDRPTVNMLDAINDGLHGHLWMLKAWQS